MINKPKKLGYPELLRVNAPQRQAVVDATNQAQKEYESYVLTELVKEFGTASLGELLFCVVEAHHKTLKIKGKKGVKQQWTPLLASIIRVEVDARRAKGLSLKAIKKEFLCEPLWAPYLLNSESQFDKVYKQGHKEGTYKYAKAIYKSKDEWNALLKSELSKFLSSK